MIVINTNPIRSTFVEIHMLFLVSIEEVGVESEMKFSDYDAPIMNTFIKIMSVFSVQ